MARLHEQRPLGEGELDVEALCKAAPPTATLRGMFFNFLVEASSDPLHAKMGGRRYIPFKSYPIREYVELASSCAAQTFPELPLREALRRLGWRIYPGFARTIVGTAIFTVAGHSFRRVVEAAPNAYRVSIHPGAVEVPELRDGYARVQLRNIWSFVDSLHLGIWEGAMQHCGAQGEIILERRSICDVDLDIHWQT